MPFGLKNREVGIMEKIALILDLDNTLYCWVDSFALALDSQITYLAKQLLIPKKLIKESFKKTFGLYGSIEVKDASFFLNVWDNLEMSSNEKRKIQENANQLFLDRFASELQLFPSVKETLDWSKEKGILLFAFSDASAYWINFRLDALNILEYFEKIYTAKDNEQLSSEVFLDRRITSLEESLMKPNTYVIDCISKEYCVDKDKIVVVGDNKKKDIVAAKKAGVVDVWASYGMNYSQKSRRLLSSVTPWTRSQRAGAYRIKPTYSIDVFSEIIHIIECRGTNII